MPMPYEKPENHVELKVGYMTYRLRTSMSYACAKEVEGLANQFISRALESNKRLSQTPNNFQNMFILALLNACHAYHQSRMECLDLSADLALTSQNISDWQDQIIQAEKDVQNAQLHAEAQVQAAQTDRSDWAKKVSMCNEKIRKLNTENQGLSETVKAYEKELGAYEKHLGDCDEQLRDYEQKIGNYEKQLGDCEKQLGDYEKQLGDYEQKIGDYEKKIQAYEKQLADLHTAYAKWEIENQKPQEPMGPFIQQKRQKPKTPLIQQTIPIPPIHSDMSEFSIATQPAPKTLGLTSLISDFDKINKDLSPKKDPVEGSIPPVLGRRHLMSSFITGDESEGEEANRLYIAPDDNACGSEAT